MILGVSTVIEFFYELIDNLVMSIKPVILSSIESIKNKLK